MNAPALVQQVTHLVHPDHSYRLSYLLRQFVDNTGKIHNDRKQTKHKRKNNEQTVHAANISRQKSNGVTVTDPGQTACSARWSKLSSLAAVASS